MQTGLAKVKVCCLSHHNLVLICLPLCCGSTQNRSDPSSIAERLTLEDEDDDGDEYDDEDEEVSSAVQISAASASVKP